MEQKLKELGIVCMYGTDRFTGQKTGGLNYCAAISEYAFDTPEKTKEYLRNVVDAVIDDATEKNGLEGLELKLSLF